MIYFMLYDILPTSLSKRVYLVSLITKRPSFVVGFGGLMMLPDLI